MDEHDANGAAAGSLAVAWLCWRSGAPAQAHPHVWITFETTVLYDKGTFIGVRHKWTFDEFYTAMAIEGLDKNKDGKSTTARSWPSSPRSTSTASRISPSSRSRRLPARRSRSATRATTGSSTRTACCRCIFTLPFASPVLAEAKGFDVLGLRSDLFHRLRPGQDAEPAKLSRGRAQGLQAQVGAPEQRPARPRRSASR